VYGIAVLGSDLFIVRNGSQINVYNTDSFTITRRIDIPPDSSSLAAIIACPINNCLFISDFRQNVVHRYDLSNDEVTSWPVTVGRTCYGLSFINADNGSFFATMFNSNSVEEYTSEGTFKSVIKFDPCVDPPYHCIPLSSAQLLVSHEGATHQVCIVDKRGHILKSDGESPGSGVQQLFAPGHTAFDTHGNILIADCYINRIVRMTPELDFLENVSIHGEQQLNCPYALHLDKKKSSVYRRVVYHWTRVCRQ